MYMVNYNCQRCGYETNRKSALRNHLLRKNMCKSKLKELSRYSLLLLNNFDEEAKKCDNILKISSKTSSKYLHNNEDNPPKKSQEVNNICKYCSKKLSNYKNKWRHEKNCKEKKDEDNKVEIIELLKKQMEKRDEMIEKLTDKLIKLEAKYNMINSNNVNSNNTNNNIVVNNFGEEKLENLQEIIELCLKGSISETYIKMIDEIHYKIPENRNIFVTNVNNKFLKLLEDGKKKLRPKSYAIDKLYDKQEERLNTYIEENEDIKKKSKYVNRAEKSIMFAINEEKSIKDDIRNILVNKKED